MLQLQLLRWAFSNPDVHVYDMLGGGGKAEQNKRKWATEMEPLYTLRVFRRDIPGMVAWLRYVVGPWVKHRLTGKPGKQHQPLVRENKGEGNPDLDA